MKIDNCIGMHIKVSGDEKIENQKEKMLGVYFT